MSKKHKESHKKIERESAPEVVVETPDSDSSKVKMIFTEAKFYNDSENPIFEPNKVYELEGADWIQRWVKRGGAIVDEKTNKPVPADGDKEEKVEETVSNEDAFTEEDAKEDSDNF